jgi:hypothetical protein
MAALAQSTATSIGAVTSYYVDATADEMREALGPGFLATQSNLPSAIMLGSDDLLTHFWQHNGRWYKAVGRSDDGWPSGPPSDD